MAHKRGDRICAFYQNAKQHGVVVTGGKTKVSAILDSGTRVAGNPALFMPSNEPFPPGSYFERAITEKGTRVSFEFEGVKHEGVVQKGDLFQATVMAGSATYVLGQDTMQRSEFQPEPDTPSAMDRWAVKSYKHHAGLSQETDAFDCDVLLDGKKVLKATNTGHGGSNMYYGDYAIQTQLEQDAREWCEIHGAPQKYEAADIWLGWKAVAQPCGMTAREYLAGFNFDSPAPGM